MCSNRTQKYIAKGMLIKMINFGVVGTSWITDEFIRCASLTGEFCLQAVY